MINDDGPTGAESGGSAPISGDDDNLFESGIVNSLFAVQLTTFVEARFGIEVGMDDLEIENFKSINATAGFVARKTAGP